MKKKEKDFIRQITEEKYNTSKNLKKNSSKNIDSNNKMEINTSISSPKEFNYYMSPLHSLRVLGINNKVCSNIKSMNLKRQKYIFNKSIYDISKSKIHHINSLSRIKISELTPIKSNDIISLGNSTNSKIPFLNQNSLKNIFKSRKKKIFFFAYVYQTQSLFWI